jgi:hypothetical protein
MDTLLMEPNSVSDEQLWRASCAGDRDAFGRIVERYQSLVCALAYSGTGNLAGSQDLAQETFVTAWRQMNDLREPLVLFYREEKSIVDVATQLELSQEAVKQRLSRGRSMLREEIAAIVETTLTRTRPKATFTAGVLAAIAVAAPSKAAAGTIAAASGVAAGKGVVGAIGGASVIGPASGLATAFAVSKIAGMTARSADERRSIARHFRRAIVFCLSMVALLLAGVFLGQAQFTRSAWFAVLSTFGWTAALLGGIARVHVRAQRDIDRIRKATGTEDAAYSSELARRGLTIAGPVRRESAWRMLGLPLWCYASGGLDVGSYRTRMAIGWIAVGDVAVSPLVAIGGVAMAPVAIGGATVGILSLSIAGLAIGVLALGSLAAGWWAIGFSALAWKGAAGAAAVAHDYAVGGIVSAAQANTPAAVAWFAAQWFTGPTAVFATVVVPWLILASIVVPVALMLRRAWRLRRRAPPR